MQSLITQVRDWLQRNRNSTRVAFVLRAVCLILTVGLSLWWARALVQTLGPEVYGLYLAFLAVAQLGGLGDLGISGAVGIRMMQHLARSEDEQGRRLLANARAVFLGLALLFLLGFAGLSPWLPGWLGFDSLPAGGSLTILFALGGVGGAVLIISGYFQNLNYIHGNVVWPIIPGFIFLQLGFLGQWLLARHGAPLWAQYSMPLLMAVAGAVVAVWMLKASHPWLGDLRPVRFDWLEARQLVSTSFWVYLCTLGNLIYVTTDQILVNAGFGSGQVPAYRFNYKLCELALNFLSAASFVAMPAIAQRLLSLRSGEREQGLSGLERLQQLQTFAGVVAAIAYLCFNDLFISVWLGEDFRVPLLLQTAFALNFAITIAGDAALQVRGRLNLAGIRLAGLVIGGAGLLNLVLSFAAMKAGSLVGIAAATVVAQSVANFLMSRSTCRELSLPFGRWMWRGWLVPVGAVGLGALLRWQFPPISLNNALALALGACGLFAGLALALGVRWQLAVDEWKRFRTSFR